MASLLRELAGWLAIQTNETLDSELFAGSLPPSETDAANVLLERGGIPPGRGIDGSIGEVAFQVLSRGASYETARSLAYEIYDVLSSQGAVNIALGDWHMYSASAVNVPQYLGFDVRGRPQFSTNYTVRCFLVSSGSEAQTAQASQWLYGADAPDASIGTIKDFYLDLSTYDIYNKASGSWEAIGNILGAEAPTQHSALLGLTEDDHGQYHTDARGDARYAPVSKGVTGGDSHDHTDGRGGTLSMASIVPTVGHSIPAHLYALEGREFNLYYLNAIRCDELPWSLLKFDVTVTGGGNARMKQEDRRWTYTPIAADAGDYAWELKVKFGKVVLLTATATLHVVALTAGTGAARQAIYIGDSIMAEGSAFAEDINLFGANQNSPTPGGGADVMSLTWLGTQSTTQDDAERNSRTAAHECYPGWGYTSFYTTEASPFVYSGVFDFAQYMSENGITLNPLDLLFFNCGVNDMFGQTTDAGALAKIDTIIGYMDAMIANIQTAAPGVRIAICTPIPPANSQTGFGDDYGSGQTQELYARYNDLLQEALVAHYSTGFTRVYLLPIHLGIDTETCMQTTTRAINARNSDTETIIDNGLHPSPKGGFQIADMLKSFIKWLETLPTTTITLKITNGLNDSRNTGTTYPGQGSHTTALTTGIVGANTTAFYCLGFRFTSVAVPNNAALVSAKWRGLVNATRTNDTQLLVLAAASDNCPSWVTGVAEPATIARLSETVEWTRTDDWVGGQWYDSPSLVHMLQQIFVRTGWASGNALGIILQHALQSLPGANAFVTFNMADMGADNGAELEITYCTA